VSDQPAASPMPLVAGQVLTAQRTIVEADITAFGALVGDESPHHLPGEQQMAHGLLTASLATQIGGRLHFIARNMSWEFLRPVWAGDTITAEVTIRELSELRSGTGLVFDIVIYNQHRDVVLRGQSTGLIRH
jgi:3-hydroxybutyryl-CoA dehydratase